MLYWALMARANSYRGLCKVCGTTVLESEGFIELSEGKWITKCKPCSGVAVEAKPRISIWNEGSNALVKPKDYLGGNLFNVYRKCVDGAKFNMDRKLHVAHVSIIAPIITRLHESGFALDVHPDLGSTIQAHAATIRSEVGFASDRADQVDAALRERGLALFPFQKTGVKWLATRIGKGCLLADDMGTGKTIQVLTALPKGAPVLVVSPAIAKGVWARETKKWRPDLTGAFLEGRGSFRWPQVGELLVTNYEILSDSPEGQPVDGTIIVADEAHILKNFKAKKTKRFQVLSEAVLGRVWLVTATPLLNKPGELWSVLRAGNLTAEAFGSWKNYFALFNGSLDQYGPVWGEPSPEVAERLQRVSLRRTKAEVLPELPLKIHREITVDIDLPTKKLCSKIEKALAKSESYNRFSRILGEESPSSAVVRLIEEDRADQLANYGMLVEEIDQALDTLKRDTGSFEEMSKARAALAKAKIPALIELVESFEEQGEPVVVFSAHRAPIDIFEKREGWRVITGDTPPKVRTEIEDLFQAGKLKGVAGTIKAMGVSITLTKAYQAVFVDREWTPSLNDQAEDRVCRIGQTRGVIITNLVAEVYLDQRVSQLLGFKRVTINSTVEAISNKEPVFEVPEIDLTPMTLLANEEKDKAAKVEAEAAARRAEFEANPDLVRGNLAASQAQKKKEIYKARILRGAQSTLNDRRPAKDAKEAWAMSSIQRLVELDPDRAREKNHVGFNVPDSAYGRKFAVLQEIGLTEEEWEAALKLCVKYHRQVGVFE